MTPTRIAHAALDDATRATPAGNWLTKDQAEALLNAPDTTTLRGKRDRALLGILVGCGLWREEAAKG